MDENPNNSKQPWLLYGWLVVIIFSVVLVLVTLPKMRMAIHESQMVPLVSSYLEQARNQDDPITEIPLQFPIPVTNSHGFSYATFLVPTENNPNTHAIVEAILHGPTSTALSEGAISHIPKETQLIGLTVSNDIAFIDLSDEFLQETPWELASHALKIEQLRRNLLSNREIRDMVLLIEGKPIEEIIEERQSKAQ